MSKKTMVKIKLTPLEGDIAPSDKLSSLLISNVKVPLNITVGALKKYIFDKLDNEKKLGTVKSPDEIKIYYKASFKTNDEHDMRILKLKDGDTVLYCKDF